jgi:hypothetical protein
LISTLPNSWAVDGAPGGTTGRGLVKGGTSSAVYTAPATQPSGPRPTVVAVSVQVKTAKGTKLISAVVTILTGYHVVAKFKELKSGLVCAGTVAASVTDSLSFDLVLTGENTYSLTNLKNVDSAWSGVRVPVVGYGVTVKAKPRPDVFKATDGSASLLSDTQLVSVGLNGDITIGTCMIAGAIATTGQTSGESLGFSFYTSNFFNGRAQTNLKSDHGRDGWLWTVTEK